MADCINCKEAGVAGASCCQSDGSSVFSCLGILFRSRYQKSTGEEKRKRRAEVAFLSPHPSAAAAAGPASLFPAEIEWDVGSQAGRDCHVPRCFPIFYAGQK